MDLQTRTNSGLAWRTLPLLLLLTQIFVLHEKLVRDPRVRPTLVADTASYIDLSQKTTLDGVLTHYRTYGYPLLIRTFGWRELPGLELWLFFLGALCLFGGVAAYTGNAWIGLAAASPVLWGDALALLGRVQPDFVSCAFVLMAAGTLLALVRRPRNVPLWLVLACAVVAAYQSRPAALFLVVWLPALGGLLWWLHGRGAGRAALHFALALALAVLLPCLAYMGLRYARVGEFALVSFGGYNMSGLAASLIDEAMLGELEGESLLLAKRVFARRSARGWSPYDPAEGSEAWFRQYNDNIWRISVAVANQRFRAERKREPVGAPHRYLRLVVNEKLKTLSREVIRRRPGKYLRWVIDANVYGWRQLAGSPWVMWPAAVLALSLLLLRATRRPGEAGGSVDARAWALLLLGGTYFLAYVAAISLLSFPFERYYRGTVLLLPSGLCAVSAAVLGVWLSTVRGRRSDAPRRSAGGSRDPVV